jgi:hypothetical protein
MAMSSKVTGWAWEQDLPVQRKCVLLWLAERATDNGVCFPGQPEIRQKTGLSESVVRRYLHALASDQDDTGQTRKPLIRIIQRPVAGDRNTSNVYVLLVPWAADQDVRRELEELKHIPRTHLGGVGVAGAPQGGGVHVCTRVGVAGAPQVGVAGDREEPSLPDPDRELPPIAPELEQPQQQGIDLCVTASDSITARESEATPDDPAHALASAFYRGLGAEVGAVTAAIRRRDIVIARQLLAAGATAAEAEAYAREATAASGRIAPVDLRSFERERLGWLARRRGREQSQRQIVDRTGQPPSWQGRPPDPISPRDERVPVQQAAFETPPNEAVGTPEVHDDQLAHKLRTLLRREGTRP